VFAYASKAKVRETISPLSISQEICPQFSIC